MPDSSQQNDRALEAVAAAVGDDYEVLERIGGGGMADVYLARHQRHGGFCAVKVLADHLARDEDIVRRFLQEARTAAGLEGCQNIIRVVDVDRSGEIYYMIMPYVDGEDLESWLARRQRMTPEEAAFVIREVAVGLAGAHRQGVVHRDLKPANIRLDPQGRITVLDFGIAKAAGPSAMTQVGEKLGTSYYMAPEQIRGEGVDARTDLYSLGVVFFELLTGRRPFTGETHYAIEQQHLHADPPDPVELDGAIPQELADVCLYLMEKEPDSRYQSAQDVVEVLRPWAPSEPPENLRPEVDGRLERVRRNDTPAPTLPPSVPQAKRRDGFGDPRPMPRGKPPSKPLVLIVGGVVLLAIAAGGAIWYSTSERPSPAEPAEKVEPIVQPQDEDPSTQPATAGPPPGMVLVPAGPFRFGDSSPGAPNPARTASTGAYFIDRTAVSNAEYKRFCDATGRRPPDPAPWDRNYFAARPNHPVINVTFEDAQAYAAWAGKRLPTELEWEKAARGDDGRTYPWGFSTPEGLANFQGAEDGHANTAPVDAFPAGASPYLALNMAGNVWEWTATVYPATPEEIADMEQVMRESSSDWRVLKGGSFVTPKNDRDLHAYMRAGSPVKGKNPAIGFRCVKDAN